MGDVRMFKSSKWTPLETAIRHSLVRDSRDSGIGMKDHLTNLVVANTYPRHFETPFKIHTILSVLFRDELEEFKTKFKGKFNEADPLSATNTYFLRIMENICKSYGINMLEVAKGKK